MEQEPQVAQGLVGVAPEGGEPGLQQEDLLEELLARGARRRHSRRVAGVAQGLAGERPLALRRTGPTAAHQGAVQRALRAKRQRMLEGLEELGLPVNLPPQGGLYCWGNLSRLPPPLNTGMGVFRAGLNEQVIVVPGELFDVNPDRPGRLLQYPRFSFGPNL